MLVAFFLMIALCVVISGYVINKRSDYYKYGVTGDAAAYYFHYEDHLHSQTRCLLGQGLKSQSPLMLFFLARLLPRSLILYQPFVIKIIIEFLSTIIFGLFLFVEGESFLFILVFASSKYIFSDINIPLKENRQFYTFSPRLIGQELCALFFTLSLISDIGVVKFLSVLLLVLIGGYNSHFSRQFIFIIAAPIYLIHAPILFYTFILFLVLLLIISKNLRNILKSQLELFQMQFSRLKRANTKLYSFRSIFALTAGECKHSILILFLNIFLIAFTDLATLQSALIYILLIVLLVSTKPLEFIGEHWRYALYGNTFLVPLCAAKIFETQPEIYIVLLAAKMMNVFWLFKKRISEGLGCNENKHLHASLEAASLQNNNIIWCSDPFRLSTIAVNFGIGKIASEFPIGQLGSIKELNKFYPCIDYNVLSTEVTDLSSVSHFLLEKNYIKNLKHIKNVFSLQKVYEDENYLIYRVGNGS